MPSACTKPDNKASLEAPDSLNKAIQVVEKKVRNLEKRKFKLDDLREKSAQGEELNRDQQEAIEKYDVVVQNLEFARELQKQFFGISAEVEKIMKKQTKKEKLEKQAQDKSRVRDILQLQGLLDSMGSDAARQDFKTGARGAIALSEDNLTQLDELYKLISPSRDEDSYDKQLEQSSEHLVCFLEGKDKEVAGTTYQNLKAVVDQIHESGYFDNPPPTEEEEQPVDPTGEEAEEVEEEEAAVQPEFTIKQEETQHEEIELAQPVMSELECVPQSQPTPVQHHPEAAHLQHAPQQQQQQACPPQPDVEQLTQQHPLVGGEEQQDVEGGEYGEPDDSFFSTVPFPRQRPFQEIVSSTQGSFNFLQDSELDESAAHIDPAVVAAHRAGVPHPHQHQQQTESSLSQQGYQTSSLRTSDDQTSHSQYASREETSHSQYQSQSQPDTTSAVGQSLVQDMVQQQSASVDSSVISDGTQQQTQLQFGDSVSQQPQQTSSYVSQPSALVESSYSATPDSSYTQNLMSQSLSNTAAQLSFGDQSATSSLGGQMGMEQSVGLSEAAGQSDAPQPIPLPNQTLPGQSLIGQTYDDQQTGEGSDDMDPDAKPTFSMNPNAASFTSMYTPPSMAPQINTMTHSNMSTLSSSDDPKTYSQTASMSQTDYQGSGYSGGSGGFGQRGGQGGNRGGSRGAPRGGARGGMNNGFNRGGGGGSSGGRGGGSSTFASNNNNRGGTGGFNNSRGNSRTGGTSSFQGYPARNDYRPEGGYQGYNSNFTPSFNNRRGSGPPRGTNNSRGGAPAMRGAAPARGGNTRGSNTGFGRPPSGSGGYQAQGQQVGQVSSA